MELACCREARAKKATPERFIGNKVVPSISLAGILKHKGFDTTTHVMYRTEPDQSVSGLARGARQCIHMGGPASNK